MGSITGPHISPSVVIAAWVSHNDIDDILVPEIWQYFLPPVEWIHCLNLRETFWDLKLDLQSFVTVGTRMLLFGSEEGHDDEAEVQEDIDRRLPRWDVAIEISRPSERGSMPPPASPAAGQDKSKESSASGKKKEAAKVRVMHLSGAKLHPALFSQPAAKPKAAPKPKGKVSDAAASADSANTKAPSAISRKRGSVVASASRSRSISVMPGGSVGPDSSEKQDDDDQDVLAAAAGDDKLYCVCKTKYDEDRFMIACYKCVFWFR